MESKTNIFIEPIFLKKKNFHLSSYIKMKRLVNKLKKTSPSFDMMMEIYNFLNLLSDIYMYGNTEEHFLFSGTVPNGYDASMIYKENNFDIIFLLRKYDRLIAIEINRKSRSKNEKSRISFHEGENIINNQYDEQRFIFIISCLMNGVIDLIEYYYKNKKL